MITMDALQWVVFGDASATPLADDKALVRWAQARGLTALDAWHVDNAQQLMIPCHLSRTGINWSFTYPHAPSMELNDVHWDVPADPSDDPRVLRIVEAIEAGGATTVLEPVRWTLSEWPPYDLHADADPNMIGQKLGSVYDIDVIDDTHIGRYWHYCPDRVALVAEHLEDSELGQLLDYLEGRVSLTMVNERLEPHERERFIDQTFLDPNPELSEMLTGLLTRALDLPL